MHYVENVLEDLAAVRITRRNSPPSPVAPNETVMGTACDEVKRAHALLSDTAEELQALFDKNRPAVKAIEQKPKSEWTADDHELADRLALHNARFEMLRNIAWHEVREQFPSLATEDMGMRKNWVVVKTAKPKRGLHLAGMAIISRGGNPLEGLPPDLAEILGHLDLSHME